MLNGCRVSVLGDENILNSDDGTQHRECNNFLEIQTKTVKIYVNM